MISATAGTFADLIAALRQAGVPVGVREELRLRLALSTLLAGPEDTAGAPHPSLDSPAGDGVVRRILLSVLARSDDETNAVEQVFAGWLAARRAAQEEDHPVVLPRDAPEPPSSWVPLRPGRLRRLLRQVRAQFRAVCRWAGAGRVVALLLIPVLAVVLGRLLWHSQLPTPHPPHPVAPSQPVSVQPQAAAKLDFARPDRFLRPEPVFSPVGGAPLPPLLPLAPGGAAALLLGAIMIHLRRRGLLPRPAPVPHLPGPPRVLPVGPHTAGVLLPARDEELLVHGIGRFLSDEQTRRLDVPATVRATVVAAGVPSPRLLLARHEREVWLWLDERVLSGPAAAEVRRLVAEVSRSLRQAGVVLHEAHFRDVPERLEGKDGAFEPTDVEERREAALVAVFTDGRGLRAWLASAELRGACLSVLRMLSGWPYLCFVDCSRGAGALRAELSPRGLEVVLPNQVAAFLGLMPLPADVAPPPGLHGDLRLWAALCALCPYPVDDDTAFALRTHMGLSASPWHIGLLRDSAVLSGGRLSWPHRDPARPVDRVRLLRWMLGRGPAADGPPVAAGPWRKAAAFHRQRLRDEDRRRAREHTDEQPWADTPAQRRLRIETALLDLWNDPEQAAQDLWAYHGGPSGPDGQSRRIIESALGELAPFECAGAQDRVLLPFVLARLSPTAQVMLFRMGLSGGLLRALPALRRPGRHGMAAGLCLGVMLASALAAWHASRRAAPQVVADGPQAGRHQVVPLPGGRFQVWAWHGQGTWSQALRAGSVVRLSWQERERPCEEALGTEVVLLRCGDVVPQRVPRTGGRTVAVVALDRDRPGALPLARRLLDSGSADEVVLGAAAGLDGASPPLPPALSAEEQALWVLAPGDGRPTSGRGAVVFAQDLAELADGLHFAKERRPVQQVWSQARPLGGGDVYLSGACPKVFAKAGGLEMVRVCGGVFQMGSEDGDNDEKPVHPVRVSQFWIGRYEVSRGDAGEKEDPDLPWAGIDWKQAQQFCQSKGLVLPSEAEWEFAARGVDGRTYPWGNQAPSPDRAAYVSGEWTTEKAMAAKPVRVKDFADEKIQGPFGTLNQAGNVWEWVEDWYQEDAYARRRQDDKPVVNPLTTDSSSGLRVLRGGSFGSEPRGLRSASRLRGGPGGRNWSIGFRCVWSPVRQPGALAF